MKDKPVTFQIDSGSTINILPRKYLSEEDNMTESSKTLKMYNGSTEKACGESRIIRRNPVTMKKYKITFVVIDENRRPIIGKLTAEKMGLITINYPKLVCRSESSQREKHIPRV